MQKQKIRHLIEPFIYSELQENEYLIRPICSRELLTWNRLDLAFKLFYLENKNKNFELASKIYKSDINAQTLGKFVEFGNESKKNSFQDYLKCFEEVFIDIKLNGFDENNTLIPLCREGSIINGAHRVASAIYQNKQVKCIKTERDSMIADYNFFFNRNVSENILDSVVCKFIEYQKSNTYIAFLWPSGKGNKKKVESYFPNIVYKKTIALNVNGAHNLLIELYKHMDWVGSKENNYKGVEQKLLECFPSFEPFTVIVFQAETIDEVRDIKEKVRKVYKLGFSSIHITDTKEEAERVSKLIFNDNGLHFLNFAKPNKYKSLQGKLDDFLLFLKKNNIDSKDAIIDGSTVLAIYGLRQNDDIDCLLHKDVRFPVNETRFDVHDSELKFHGIDKANLLFDSTYHFIYSGIKFVSFHQTYIMKRNRDENKDKSDYKLMDSLIEGNKFKKYVIQLKQKMFYIKIKVNRSLFLLGINVLKKCGLYGFVRRIYRVFK